MDLTSCWNHPKNAEVFLKAFEIPMFITQFWKENLALSNMPYFPKTLAQTQLKNPLNCVKLQSENCPLPQLVLAKLTHIQISMAKPTILVHLYTFVTCLVLKLKGYRFLEPYRLQSWCGNALQSLLTVKILFVCCSSSSSSSRSRSRSSRSRSSRSRSRGGGGSSSSGKNSSSGTSSSTSSRK